MRARPHRLQRVTLVLVALGLVVAMASPVLAADRLMRGHQEALTRNRHGLGLTFGWAGATGFAYRHYFGNTLVEANLLPLVTDQGDWLAIMMGVSGAHYMLVWQRMRGSVLPRTTALRAVVKATTFFSRDATVLNETPAEPNCVGTGCATTLSKDAKLENLTSLAGGFGFEFGAVLEPGFSMAVDMMFTVLWDEEGFQAVLPLPYLGVLYNW